MIMWWTGSQKQYSGGGRKALENAISPQHFNAKLSAAVRHMTNVNNGQNPDLSSASSRAPSLPDWR